MNDDSMKTIGRYIIEREIGRGGMAIVYQAHDPHLDRSVAIKLIRKGAFTGDQLETLPERFRREARALAKLDHPNIVKDLDYGEFDGSTYLVMEYLEGITLKEVKKPLRVEMAVRLIRPIAEALEYVHDHGILHRDVKPSNIMITATKKVMLTDFGIAKWLEDRSDQFTLTGAGIGIGTPEYMAPEQGLGKKIDARADMYALTVVFYELISGRKPFSGETPLEVLTKQVSDPIPDPRTIIPELNESVKKFLDRAMAKKPEDRYPTMMDYLRDLDGLRLQSIAEAASGNTGIQVTSRKDPTTNSSVRFGKTDMRRVREAAEDRSSQAPKASGEDNTGRVTTKAEDHQNKSAAVRKSNRLRWLLPAVGLLAILVGWIGIQRRAGRLPVEPMGTPTEMILGVERSQTDIPMIGMEPTAVVNHQGKEAPVQSGTVFPSEFIPIAMTETEPAMGQGLTLIEPQQEIIETQSPERKMATHTAIAEQKKAALYETVTAFNQRLTETKQGYYPARNPVSTPMLAGTAVLTMTPAFAATRLAQDMTSTAAKLNLEGTAIAVHQKETELAAIVTEMTLTAVAAERIRLTEEEAAARAQAERIRLTELSLPTETPEPAATLSVDNPYADIKVGKILPRTGFAPGRITKLPEQPAAKLYQTSKLLMKIPALNQSLEIIGILRVDGEWDIAWLGQYAGYLEGSAYPTWEGNSIITAHVWAAYNNPGPFFGLKDLRYGDKFMIEAYGKTYTYEIRESEQLLETDVEKMMTRKEGSWITLMTCTTYDASEDRYKYRYLVRGVLIEVN